jgi:hypothetical protein
MHDAVKGRPADLACNLDEVGISDEEHRQPKKVVVPIASLTSYVVTSQDSTAVRRDLEGTGCKLDGI